MVNHFIDNKFVPGLEGGRFETLNPANNQPITEVASGSAPDVDRTVKAARAAFDYIFLDPPFRYPAKAVLISLIAARGVLSADGLILLHLPKAEARDLAVTDFEVRDERRYDNSHVIFYGKKTASAGG